MAQAQFPATVDGVPISILPVAYGQSQEKPLTTVAIGAFVVNATLTGPQCVRVWAIGCDLFFNAGAAAVGAPTLADAFVPNGGFVDTYLAPAQTHMRAVAKTGSGTLQVELLG